METENTVVGTFIVVGQNVYRIKDLQGNSDLICIAVSKEIAQMIANKFNFSVATTIADLEKQGKWAASKRGAHCQSRLCDVA